jgi:hypothetical protein
MRWIAGPVLFEKFPMHLQVSNLDTWNILSVSAPQTVVGFNDSLDSLKRSKFLDDAYDRQVDFLCLNKKPKDVEPSAFNAMLNYHNIILAELPGAPPAAPDAMLSDTEMHGFLFTQCQFIGRTSLKML